MRVYRGRVYFVVCLSILWGIIVAGRIFYLKVNLKNYYEKMLKLQNSYKRSELAKRGDIFDRGMEILASSEKTFSLYVDVKNVKNKKYLATKLSKLLGLPFNLVINRITKRKGFLLIKRFIPQEVAEKVRKEKLPGVYLMDGYKRIYPKGPLLSHVLGGVKIDKGGEKGLMGIEYQYENFLKGENGVIFYKRDALSRVLEQIETKKPIPGDNLILSIDIRLQYVLEKALKDGILKAKAKRGTAILMDPYTGEILAYACYPSFDPGNLRKANRKSLRNFAITDVFEPGSTFKIVTFAAAIQEGVYSLNDKIYCGNGKIKLFNTVIRDHHKYELLSVNDILTHSSDVGTIKMALKLGDKTVYNYMKRFGFGEKTGVDLPGESKGSLRNYKLWERTSLAYMSMGQGLGVTPLQMVRAYCVVANGGYLVRPHLVKKIVSSNFRKEKNIKIYKVKVLEENTVEQLKKALVSVVDRGTGRLASIPGYQVAGKTGTAEMFDAKLGKYSDKNYFASFVGFVPAEKPAFVIGVFVDSPQNGIYGGEVAAPIFKEIAESSLKILNIYHPENIEEQNNVEKTLIVSNDKKSKDSFEIKGKKSDFADVNFSNEPFDSEQEIVLFDVADDAEKVVVSDFRGHNKRDCIKLCCENGLTIREFDDADSMWSSKAGNYYYNSDFIAYRQDPPPGSIVPKGTQCTIYFTRDLNKILEVSKNFKGNKK